ncbi:MAG: endonuclease/exonuclease/phosphatase family protein [Alphaproteobacteria bacterium]
MALALLLFNFLLIFPYYIKDSVKNNDDEKLSVLQFNMYYENQKIDAIYNWIINNDKSFDVIQFQEITPKQKDLLDRLKEKYPYQFMVLENGNFGFALLSRYELVNTSSNNIPQHWNKYLAATIKFHNKDIRWFGLHTIPPATKNYWLNNTKELEYIADVVKKDDNQYKLLVGDFNITPYNYRFRKLLKNSKLKSAMTGFGIKNSWSIRGIPFPKVFGLAIDHILTSSKIKTTNYDVGDFLFSDHRPIFADIVLMP